MSRCRLAKAVLLAVAALCLVPGAAQAQSTFTGVVKDTSGAVLPGATSLANPNGQGTVFLITAATRYTVCPGNSAAAGCVVGALVNPGLNVASLSVPLVAPQTEFGDRIQQLDLNIVKTIKLGHMTLQPKLDLFNVLNVSPVYSVRSLNFGTTAYTQPSSILIGRVFQLGAVLRF